MTTLFSGRSRAETKRKALLYWANNRETLRLTMREFFERCSLSPDGTAIVFHHQAPEAKPLPRLFARLRSR